MYATKYCKQTYCRPFECKIVHFSIGESGPFLTERLQPSGHCPNARMGSPIPGAGLLFPKSIIRCGICAKTCCTSNQICCLLYTYFHVPFCSMVLCAVYSDVTFGTEKETNLKCLLTVKNHDDCKSSSQESKHDCLQVTLIKLHRCHAVNKSLQLVLPAGWQSVHIHTSVA